METSQSERAAVAAVAAPTVPLKAMLRALAALEAVVELRFDSKVPGALFLQVAQARNVLEACLEPILAAQAVGVTS